MQKYTETTHRSIIWLKRANEDGRLEMKPPFQRNPVWSDKQKSALLETILLEYPIPEIYMQDIVTSEGSEKHIVVDGQQRIRAVLGYIAGEFEIAEGDSRWTGLGFEDLSPDDRKKIYEYKFVTRLLPEMPDEQIRGIFQRINRNTIVLNAQELRHATYWGEFIQLMEALADLEYWEEFGIFSPNDRRRMLDVEFVSELAVAYLNGLQNKKTKLEDYYQLYEKEFDDAARVRSTFTIVLGEIEQAIPTLSLTRFRKKSDFYSLFVLLAEQSTKLPLNQEKRKLLQQRLVGFGAAIDRIIQGEGRDDADELLAKYVKNVERAASDLGSRKARHEVLGSIVADVFEEPQQPSLKI
jgi:hypothetical protein